MTDLKWNLKDIKSNPNNPRIIKDDKFNKLVKSIKEFPAMMGLIDTVVFVSDDMATLGKSKNGKVKFRLKECKQCKMWFNTKDPKRKFCSKECYAESLRMHVKCKFCGKEIENKHSVSMKHRVYCSKECQSKARRGIKLSDEWRKKLSEGRKNSEKCKGKNLYNWKGGAETQNVRNRIYSNRRRTALKIKLDENFIKALFIAQKARCYYCGKKFTKEDNYQIEHLTPVSKGGDNQEYNIVLSCRSCNLKKMVTPMEDYSIKNNIKFAEKWEDTYTTALIIKEKLCLRSGN